MDSGTSIQEELRIGSLEDVEGTFMGIRGAAVDADGNVFVADQVRFRVFDPQGTELRAFGRHGQGPGEFSVISHFGFAGDTVWALDEVVSRITYFDGRDGTVLGTVRITPPLVPSSSPAVNIRLVPWQRHADGRFISIERLLSAGIGAPADLSQSYRYRSVLMEADGTIVAELFEHSRQFGQLFPIPLTVRGRNVLVPRLPSSDPLSLVGPTWVDVIERPIATSAAAGLVKASRILDHGRGDTVFAREYGYTPKSYDPIRIDSLIVRAVNGYVTAVARAEGSSANLQEERATVTAALLRVLPLPAFQPPILDARLGADGVIWMGREETPGGPSEWVLIAGDGAPLARLTLPRGVTVLWSHGETAWASAVDDLGVPWLVRYRLAKE